MKLDEIIQPEVSIKPYRGTFKHKSYINDKNALGSGYYSVVRQDKTDPHMIKKDQRSSDYLADDPYHIFAKEILENKLYDNIHFPKIYKSTGFKDSTGRTIMRWRMERLTEMSKLSPEEVGNLFEKYFNPDAIKGHGRTIEVFAYLIDKAVSRNDFDIIEDPELKEALQQIRIIYDKYGRTVMSVDIHSANIMIRRTPYGNQIVITDPFG